MKCPNCGVEVDPQTGVCPECHTAVAAPPQQAAEASSASLAGVEKERGPKRGDPDVQLWQASYSLRGMIGTWVILGVLTAALVVLNVLLMQGPLKDHALVLWEVTLLAAVLVWLIFLAIGWYRALTIRYRLTTYRFYHQKGFIFRTVDSMEVIDIDDISLHQNILERLANVGRIILRTKDPSDPILVLHGVPNPEEAFKRIDRARRDEQIRRSIKVQ